MCNYRKKYNTSSKLAIDRIKELEKECARLASLEQTGYIGETNGWINLNHELNNLKSQNGILSARMHKYMDENQQLREDLAATAIKAINVMTEMRKL